MSCTPGERRMASEQAADLVGVEPAELAPDAAALEHADLEVLRRELGAAVLRALERVAAKPHGVRFGEARAELDLVERVRLGAGELVVADFRDDDLDLERLQRADELVADELRVEPGERLAAHVLAAEAKAFDVRPLHADLPEAVELAVLAHAGERDAVVDLADLREVVRVLRDQDDAALELERDERLAAGDALAGELRLVLRHLLRGDVERHDHGYAAPARRRCISAS